MSNLSEESVHLLAKLKLSIYYMAEEKGDLDQVSQDVIYGHKICQTLEAKWLCLEEIYQKFYRPNFYDIGGTYIQDIADYWFMCKTEQVGTNFLLHLFVFNRQEASFNITLSYSNEITIDRKSKIAYLASSPKEYQFKNIQELNQSYITTYHFTELDVDSLKDRKLYVSIKFPTTESKSFNQEIIENIKADHDFGALLSDPIGSDFTIESMDGEKFLVHKVLLAAHSEVFKAMLKEETAESQNNYVKLIDVGKEDLQCILQFIYTGTVQDLQNCNCTNLLILADKYDLTGLRQLVQYALSQQLSSDNVLEILMVSDMFNSDMLKTAALKFIKRNPAVIKSSAFKEIQNADLVRELCDYLVPS